MNFRHMIGVIGAGWLPLSVAAACLASTNLAWPAPAVAQPIVSTDSAVFIERHGPDSVRQLEPADSFVSGDRVVTILRWQRMGGDGGFTITNPMPKAIAFQRSSRADGEVSVDGGRTWGRMGELKIGSRLATPEDVTHVRWRISPRRALAGSGQIAYSAIVR